MMNRCLELLNDGDLLEVLPAEYFLLEKQVVVSCGCVMPIGMNALPHMPLRNPRSLGQLLQESSVQLRLIEAYSDATGDFN